MQLTIEGDRETRRQGDRETGRQEELSRDLMGNLDLHNMHGSCIVHFILTLYDRPLSGHTMPCPYLEYAVIIMPV